MVEGPGATRNGRKAQAAISLVVTKCNITLTTTAQQQESCSNALVGRRLVEVFSIGKEVFLIFSAKIKMASDSDEIETDEEEFALRLHFGMNGSLWVRKNSGTAMNSQSVPSWRKNEAPCLQIFFEPDFKHSSTTSATILEASAASTIRRVSSSFVARSKLIRLGPKDVCGDNFCEDSVLAAILQQATPVMICDAILNQDRFPGVGNIIKVEALHEARIHPKRFVSDLSESELRQVIRSCRHYAMRWLSAGRAPTKKVYNQTNCATCQNLGCVRIAKMGNDLSRVTFWCSNCQLSSTQLQQQQLPTSKENRKRGIHEARSDTNNGAHKLQPKMAKLTNTTDQTAFQCCACPQHGETSLLLRRVRKDGVNRNRIFWTCKRRGCQFFQWADSHLPLCSCRRKVILRISKTERSGGKWFLSCSSGSNQERNKFRKSTNKHQARNNAGCSHFAWADAEKHMAPLGKLLTPLL